MAKERGLAVVLEYLQQWGHRLVLHFLPSYAPDTNPIKRVSWHLHETITRKHRCETLTELIESSVGFFFRYSVELSNAGNRMPQGRDSLPAAIRAAARFRDRL